jgi:sterol desaturase/sphingolipid hydroxylase (fatty acid hydroxylase superfamily)
MNVTAFAEHVYSELHWISAERWLWFSIHIPVYWGLCLVLYLLGIGRLTAAQEAKNKVSRSAVAWRILEVQLSQLSSYVAIEEFTFVMDNPLDLWGSLRWTYVIVGLLVFDLVEYVMHRIYHHRLLYKRVHKAHHLLWCPYPYASLYNSTIEYTITGAMIFLTFRALNYSLPELVVVNTLGTVKTIFDHTWMGSKDAHHWVHHE